MAETKLLSATGAPPPVIFTPQVDDDGLYDIDFVCGYYRGSKPLHPATIYRGIADGRYPRPVRSQRNFSEEKMVTPFNERRPSGLNLAFHSLMRYVLDRSSRH